MPRSLLLRRQRACASGCWAAGGLGQPGVNGRVCECVCCACPGQVGRGLAGRGVLQAVAAGALVSLHCPLERLPPRWGGQQQRWRA